MKISWTILVTAWLGLIHGEIRADCTGCFASRAKPSVQECEIRWVLPDGSSLCLKDSPDRFKQLLDSFPDCRQPSKLDEE